MVHNYNINDAIMLFKVLDSVFLQHFRYCFRTPSPYTLFFSLGTAGRRNPDVRYGRNAHRREFSSYPRKKIVRWFFLLYRRSRKAGISLPSPAQAGKKSRNRVSYVWPALCIKRDNRPCRECVRGEAADFLRGGFHGKYAGSWKKYESF